MTEIKTYGNDNTQADNAVADVFFFAPSPTGDKEIKLAKLSLSFPKSKKVTVKMPFDVEVQTQTGKNATKASISCCDDSEWVWNFGDS